MFVKYGLFWIPDEDMYQSENDRVGLRKKGQHKKVSFLLLKKIIIKYHVKNTNIFQDWFSSRSSSCLYPSCFISVIQKKIEKDKVLLLQKDLLYNSSYITIS